jgi:hypothetical protein
VFCGGTLSVAPIATGNVFVASSLPNPFHNRLDLTFTCRRRKRQRRHLLRGRRKVQTLASGDMAAGRHSIQWTVDKAIPGRRVLLPRDVGRGSVDGKITRVE